MSDVPQRIHHVHYCLNQALRRVHTLCHMRSHRFLTYLIYAAKSDDDRDARATYAEAAVIINTVIAEKRRFNEGTKQDIWSLLWRRRRRLEMEWGIGGGE